MLLIALIFVSIVATCVQCILFITADHAWNKGLYTHTHTHTLTLVRDKALVWTV